tara:strand:- start:6359 stop:7723 length:1365 start_codon:yes stop_codon:yes gene_type:complete
MRGNRLRNKQQLSSGFYHAHDVLNLNFDRSSISQGEQIRKKYNKNYADLINLNMLGNMAGLKQTGPDYVFDDSLEKFISVCGDEYDKWLKSTKFSYNMTTLLDVMPNNTTVNKFFEDLVIRVPSEQCLIIKEHPFFTTILAIEEYSKAEKHNYIRDTLVKKAQVPKEALKSFDQMTNFEFDSWLKCTVTFSYCLEDEIKKDILNDSLEEEVKKVLTGRRSFFLPQEFWVPIGNQVKVSMLETGLIFPIPLIPNDPFCAWEKNLPNIITHLYTPHRVTEHGHQSIYKDEYVEEARKERNERIKTFTDVDFAISRASPFVSTLEHVLNTVIGIGILFNPDFKDACVSCKRQGFVQPSTKVFNKKNPYKNRPSQKPKFEHYIVSLNIPDEVSSESKLQGHKKRLHFRRGHLMRSTGKNAVNGFVWRKACWVGNKEIGVVTKDYVVNINDEVGELETV